MKKHWTKVLGVLMTATLMVGSLTACGSGGDEKDGKGSDVKVAIICSSAGQNDNGYNQSAVNGAKRQRKNLGLSIKL